MPKLTPQPYRVLNYHYSFQVPNSLAKRCMTPQLHRCQMKIAVFLTVLLSSVLIVLSEEQSKTQWTAPAGEARKTNPVAANESSLAAGQKIYLKRCVACHGKTGNGDGPDAADLGIHPAKLSDPAIRTQTDGELFWKITAGKKPMPSYGTRLSPTDRWNVINYLRSLVRG
jgi:mono/diheme cytochrome c family protein